MRTIAIIIFSFFSVLSVLIYLTKNHQYEDYAFKEKTVGKKIYLINMNLATWHDFASIPGIGENLAKKIIKNRDDLGRFDAVEDIKRIKGIGNKKYQLIKDYLSLEV